MEVNDVKGDGIREGCVRVCVLFCLWTSFDAAAAAAVVLMIDYYLSCPVLLSPHCALFLPSSVVLIINPSDCGPAPNELYA